MRKKKKKKGQDMKRVPRKRCKGFYTGESKLRNKICVFEGLKYQIFMHTNIYISLYALIKRKNTLSMLQITETHLGISEVLQHIKEIHS